MYLNQHKPVSSVYVYEDNWADKLLRELKSTDEEHSQEIMRVYNALRENIISSNEKKSGVEFLQLAMNTESLYETIGYGYMALQAWDKINLENKSKEEIEKYKNETKKLLHSKIPGIFPINS